MIIIYIFVEIKDSVSLHDSVQINCHDHGYPLQFWF